MDKDIRDLLLSYGFKRKPRNVFGLFKKVKNGEISVMLGMGRCDLKYTFWNLGEKNEFTFTNGYTVKYDEPNALDKIENQTIRNNICNPVTLIPHPHPQIENSKNNRQYN